MYLTKLSFKDFDLGVSYFLEIFLSSVIFGHTWRFSLKMSCSFQLIAYSFLFFIINKNEGNSRRTRSPSSFPSNFNSKKAKPLM